MIESMNGGAFLNLTGDLAYKALDKLADNSQQWDFTSCRDKSARNPKKGGIHELKAEAELNLRMDAIVKETRCSDFRKTHQCCKHISS
jgi:hypothetical protein